MKKIKLISSLASLSILGVSIAPISSCSSSTLNVIDASTGVIFDNLPTSVPKNTEFFCSFKIISSIDILDLDKTDILVSNKSIKNQEGVAITSTSFLIPANLVTGDIKIKIITKQDIKPITVTNSSSSYISFIDLPTKHYKGIDFEVEFSLDDSTKKIDFENSSITINDSKLEDIESYCQDNKITIPGSLVTGDIVISLQVKDNAFRVWNFSDVAVNFENLPSDIVFGYTINTNYTLPDSITIDTDASDIFIGPDSIKGKSGVIFDSGYLQIPGNYVTSDVLIELKVRVKETYTITKTEENITYTGLPTEVIEGNKVEATYTISDGYELDRANCDIKVGDQSIAQKSGVLFLDNKIVIPAEYVKGNIQIILPTTQPKVIDQDWSTIISACNTYEASDRGAEALATLVSSFTINGTAITSLDDLIGATKTVGFKMTVNGTDYTVEQKVRVIDHEHDLIFSDPVADEKTAALTFELCGLVTDKDGNYLTAKYGKDNKRFDLYSLWDNLNSTDEVTWRGKEAKVIDGYNQSCLTMLTKWDSSFASGIKKIDKKVAQYDEDLEKFVVGGYTYGAYLFPLTYVESGHDVTGETHVMSEGTVYKYWENSTEEMHIKRDLKNNNYHYWLTSPWLDEYVGNSWSTAFAWSITEKGELNHITVNDTWVATTFAFCI